MKDCPCCSHQMLRHLRAHEAYWFCRHCWQEMPNLDSQRNASFSSLAALIRSPLKDRIYSGSRV